MSHATFQVCDDVMVNRIVRRINGLRAYAKHVEEWAASELRRTQRQEERLMQWSPQLEAWARQRLGDGRRRSIALPGGTIGLRRQPVRPAVVSESDIIHWAREHLPEAVELDVKVTGPQVITLRQLLEQAGCEADTVEKLRRRIIIEHVKACGECPPGVEMAGGAEQLFIR